ncbi:hypothetical protein [Streptomyces sp. NPDC059862]|uniref:hypothetical protein n=1 Tax=unclassified Streptomyces TaxID=2593676 RepID=UPI00364258C2
MKHIGKKMMTTGAALLTAAGLVTAAAPSAHAAGSYNIMINTAASTYFIADYCLLTTTSGNAQAACSGNMGKSSSFRLGTVHNPGDRVWIDINIVAGTDRKGIDLRGMHYIKVRGDLGAVEVCGWPSLASVPTTKGLPLHGDTICEW